MRAATIALLAAAVLFGNSSPAAAAPKSDEVLYKTCFPKKIDEPPAAVEDCKDEDCGLVIEAKEEPAPIVEKTQKYSFLGATELGSIWGATTYRAIGDDRVRFLVYIQSPATTKVNYRERGYTLIPERVIETAFFSSFGEYQGSAVSVSYRVERARERSEETVGGEGIFEMIDLHCSARKLKIYDNHTMYYRTIETRSPERQCVELLWEKPKVPLMWQASSSLTMDILTNYYCSRRK